MFSRLFQKRSLLLMVCTANVCRSPVAATLLRLELKRRGLAGRFQVVSAGTHVASPGRPPDPRMNKLAKAVGAPLKGERAMQLTRSRALKASLIVTMEEQHRSHVQAMLEGAATQPEIRLLGSWYPGDTGAAEDIVDPYFANLAALERAFTQIHAAVLALASELQSSVEP